MTTTLVPLAWFAFAIALIATASSLHRDRMIERSDSSVVRAIRLHHLAQLAIVVVTFLVSVQAQRESDIARLAERDNHMSAALLKYEHRALTATGQIIYGNHRIRRLERDLSDFLASGKDRDSTASLRSLIEGQKRANEAAFQELQSIGWDVRNIVQQYGKRVPVEVNEWLETNARLRSVLGEKFEDGDALFGQVHVAFSSVRLVLQESAGILTR